MSSIQRYSIGQGGYVLTDPNGDYVLYEDYLIAERMWDKLNHPHPFNSSLSNRVDDIVATLREINSKINHIENRLRAGFGS